ncbi:MAG: hypothetical protein V3R74_06200, partial [Alphaproteobacteria bacterium]
MAAVERLAMAYSSFARPPPVAGVRRDINPTGAGGNKKNRSRTRTYVALFGCRVNHGGAIMRAAPGPAAMLVFGCLRPIPGRTALHMLLSCPDLMVWT